MMNTANTPMESAPLVRSAVGVVVIGRNEGQRLALCLRSALATGAPVVYVDSGSTDGSAALARSMGANVIELDASSPFTAARGRNAGLAWLRGGDADIDFVQFVDGDCELRPGWLERAAEALSARSDAAAVCGGLRERHAERSIFNRLCDLEWRRRPGLVDACGGVAMMRVQAVESVGGFDASLIAGEEPDLCARLREGGWRIVRIEDEMATHDAAMTGFGQWWRREIRSGHAAAEHAARRRGPAERHRRRALASVALWGGVAPAIGLAGLVASVGNVWALTAPAVVAIAYVALAFRIAASRRRLGDSASEAALYAVFCVVGKTPRFLGAMSFWLHRVRGRRRGLIEHKKPERTPGAASAPHAP